MSKQGIFADYGWPTHLPLLDEDGVPISLGKSLRSNSMNSLLEFGGRWSDSDDDTFADTQFENQ